MLLTDIQTDKPMPVAFVLFKMFLRWFFANKNLILISTALKLYDVTEDVVI